MLKFRPIQFDDKDAVASLFRQLTEDPVHFDISLVIEDPNCICLVAMDNGKVIGCGSVIIYRSPVKGKVGLIMDIVVNDACRGRGVGGRLLDKLIEIGRESKACMLDLSSRPHRIAARKLYESRGFEIRDTLMFRLKLI